MKKLALLLLTSQLHGTGCLEWIPDIRPWLYAGPVGKYNTLNKQETFLNADHVEETDINHTHYNSVGVQAGAGLLFPIPFFFAVDGSYSRFYSSHFDQKGMGPLKIEGSFYTYEFKAGYAFTPVCGWSISPLFAYNTDKLHFSFPSFPIVVPHDYFLRDYNIKDKITFTGPAVGFGTSLALPCGFLLSCEAFWQWREFIHSFRNDVLFADAGVKLLSSKEHLGGSTWTQGPKIDVNLDYCFGNWYVGVNGEWQYLSQFTGSRGSEGEIDVTVDIQSQDIISTTIRSSPARIHDLNWQSWVWTAYIGFFY